MASAEFEAMRELLVAAGRMEGADVLEARAAMEEMLGGLPPAEGTTFEQVEVRGRPALWVRPAELDPGATVLYLHGGAYRIGSPQAYRSVVSHYAVALRAPALLLDYRLAPEHPFPAAVDDAVAAVHWLAEQGVPSDELIVMGDSAGGGLTAATLVALRDQGDAQPRSAVCLSPWADLTLTAGAYERFGDVDPVFGLEQARRAVDEYLVDNDPTHPLASPALADLSGLAPVLVQASACEVLTDDATRLAAGIEAAGGVVELDLWPEMIHVFQAMTPGVPEAVEAVERIAAFVRSHPA